MSLEGSIAIHLARSPKFLSRSEKERERERGRGGNCRRVLYIFVGLVLRLAEESAQGPPYLCDACPRRHTSLPASVFTGHDTSKNMITRVNILGISFVLREVPLRRLP